VLREIRSTQQTKALKRKLSAGFIKMRSEQRFEGEEISIQIWDDVFGRWKC
jgi:hypothetical protein